MPQVCKAVWYIYASPTLVEQRAGPRPEEYVLPAEVGMSTP